MPYAIVQKTLEAPTIEQMRTAFRALPQLTDLDAGSMAKDAFGILVQGLDLADAGRLLQALAAVGVDAEMIDDQTLPPLPPARPCRRAEARPDAFVACDHLGRPQEFEWSKVLLLAAGGVPMMEFKHSTEERVVGYTAGPGRGMYGYGYGTDSGGVITRTVHKDREERNVKLLLDVLLAEAPGRYRIDAEKFNFDYLGDRMVHSREKNYLALVGDCIGCAGAAILNRGGAGICQQSATLLEYPSKHAFEEETQWLLWRHLGAGRDL